MFAIPENVWEAVALFLNASGCGIFLIGLGVCIWALRPILKQIWDST